MEDKKQNYLFSPLSNEPRTSSDSSIFSPNTSEPDIFPNRRQARSTHFWSWLAQFLLFLTSIAVLVISHRNSEVNCTAKVAMFSPAQEEIEDEYHLTTFDGKFGRHSPYKGPPSEELDERWNSLFDEGAFSISHETLLKIGSSEISVKLPPESGGGYMAQLEVFHQLHCVHVLFQGTHPEYYNKTEEGKDPDGIYRMHLDHCADMLRQKLMCNADLGVLTYNWVRHVSHPVPNFSTTHKCRNYSDIIKWQREHEAPMPYAGKVIRPADAVNLDDLP